MKVKRHQNEIKTTTIHYGYTSSIDRIVTNVTFTKQDD